MHFLCYADQLNRSNSFKCPNWVPCDNLEKHVIGNVDTLISFCGIGVNIIGKAFDFNFNVFNKGYFVVVQQLRMSIFEVLSCELRSYKSGKHAIDAADIKISFSGISLGIIRKDFILMFSKASLLFSTYSE